MRLVVFVLFLFCPIIVFATDENVQTSENSGASDLEFKLNDARSVPYVKDGKVDGYLVVEPDGDALFRTKKIKQGDTLTMDEGETVNEVNGGQ